MTDPIDDCGVIMLMVGDRDDLSDKACGISARAFLEFRERRPEVPILISFGGYDDDPRDLWEFPEVCRFMQRWTRLCHLVTPEQAALTAIPLTTNEITDNKWAGMMMRYRFEMIGLLGAFGCWDGIAAIRGKAPGKQP